MTVEPVAEVAPRPANDAGGKARLRFAKGFDLRLLSHHDLIRAFERLLRRAAIPLAYTRGFSPHPRIVFALSLPLGVIGRDEVVEIELARPVPEAELRERMARQAPPGLTFHGCKPIPLKVTAQVAALCYRLPVPDDRLAAVRERLPDLLASPELVVRRPKAPNRPLDLRPSIHHLRLVEIADAGALPALAGADRSAWHFTLDMELTPTGAGTARPEEVLALLGQPDLLDQGGVLERTRLRLADEPPSAVADEVPPSIPEGAPWQRSC